MSTNRKQSSGRQGNGDEKKRPWGDAFYVVNLEEDKSKWVQLAPVWEHTDGSGLDFVLDVEPIAWRNSSVERRIVIRKRPER